jgi:hypothetical protein
MIEQETHAVSPERDPWAKWLSGVMFKPDMPPIASLIPSKVMLATLSGSYTFKPTVIASKRPDEAKCPFGTAGDVHWHRNSLTGKWMGVRVISVQLEAIQHRANEWEWQIGLEPILPKNH